MTGSIADTGVMVDAAPVKAVDLANDALRVTLLSHGARIHDVRLAGAEIPLVAAPRDTARYLDPTWAPFGAIVGPVANRIALGRARLDGRNLILPRAPNQTHTLHGGPDGCHTRNWEVDGVSPTAATFTLVVRDGADGFPGNRILAVHYKLGPGAALTLTMTAMTDAPTWLNLTSHPLWSLDGRSDISGHVLSVAAERFLPTDDHALPTGEMAAVANTPFDFRHGRPVGPATTPRLDHNFCLADQSRATPASAATLTSAAGLRLSVATTAPGLQVFDAAGFDGDAEAPVGHAGAPLGAFCGLALEPQGWPDAPNRPHFPSVRVAPPATFRQVTVFRLDRV